MSGPTIHFQLQIIRQIKGIIKAWEEWLDAFTD